MSSENPKAELFQQFATVGKALGHANRLELLEFLAQGERSVEVLARRAGLSVGNASQHLQHLRRAGLVRTRREGKHIFYQLSGGAVVELLMSLRHVAEQNLAEVQRVRDGYFQERDSLEPISREELLLRMKSGPVTVLDVRPEDEFEAGHLPGATNVQVSQLDTLLSELPTGQDIIAYCRGPYCVFSFEAVAFLRARGFDVYRLEDGFPEWKAAGLPIEKT